MQIFTIKQDGFKEIKKQLLIKVIPIMLVAVIGGIVISSVNSSDKAADINVLPIIIPLTAGAAGFGLYRGVNRQKALFESFTFTITNNLITREQLNTPPISIYFNDIQEIAQHKNGSFTIKGKETVDLIGIPSQIENYSELQKALQQIQPIVVKNNVSFLQKYQSLKGLLAVGLMISVYTINNKIIVGLTGSALVALMVWSFIKIRSSKNIDNKTKRSLWWILIVLASVIAVMIIKLTRVAEM